MAVRTPAAITPPASSVVRAPSQPASGPASAKETGTRPIDTSNPYDPSWRYIVDIDWSLRLGEDAIRRIAQQVRRAVLTEIADRVNLEANPVS